MRAILILIAVSIFSLFSFAQESVSLKGSKAQELKKLVDKFKTSKTSHEAILDITCQYPNGPEAGGSEFCTISQTGTTEPTVSYKGTQAQRMRTLLESAHADLPDDSPCGMGTCHVRGAIKVDCSSQGASECSISEANTKSSKAGPPKGIQGKATR